MPNLLTGVCFPFVGLVPPDQTPAGARRSVGIWALLTLAVLVVMELWHPIRGAGTFDPLDIAASGLGVLAGWVAARAAAGLGGWGVRDKGGV